jgi:hypothetical protein
MNAALRLSPQSLSRLSAYNDADLGPHAQALWRDLCAAAAAGLPLAVVALAAALIDVVAHEDAGPAGYLDGAAFSFAGNKAAGCGGGAMAFCITNSRPMV